MQLSSAQAMPLDMGHCHWRGTASTLRWLCFFSLLLIKPADSATVASANRKALAANPEPHPIQDVIRLLKGLSAKVEFDGKKEGELYAKFEHWCETSMADLSRAIADGQSQADALQNTIQQKTNKESHLSEQVSDLETEISQMEAADDKATKERDVGRRLYAFANADLTATLAAIDSAIAALLQAQSETSEVSMATVRDRVGKVLALVGAGLESRSREQLEALPGVHLSLSSMNFTAPPRPDLLAGGDYAAHVDKYAFKSDGVIELLKQLRAKFRDEQVTANAEETEAENAFHLAKTARDNAISAAGASKDEKVSLLGVVRGDLNTANQQHTDVTEDLGADSTALQQTTHQCDIKKAEWEERSKVRAGEIEAMDVAQKILAKVSGVRTDPPENPGIPASPVATMLLQMDSKVLAGPGDRSHKAAALLRQQAALSKSRALQRLAEVLDSRSGAPFDEVIHMIQKMIFQLMGEQTDEDNHKNWCDLELNKTETSKDHKEDKLEELGAEITELQARVQKLTADIGLSTEMVSNIDASMQEATEIRTVGKQENKAAIKDAEDAQAAVARAITVLEKFYQDSGMLPSSLLQDPVSLSKAPSTWDSAYTGVTDPEAEGHGVLAVLKRISQDFAQMEADTRAQEQADQELYDKQIQAEKIEKARRSKEIELKGEEKENVNGMLGQLTESKHIVSSELESVKKYLKDLQPACVAGDSTYEERKAARTAEIAALKEAQGILSDPESAVAPPAPALPSPSFLQRGGRTGRNS